MLTPGFTFETWRDAVRPLLVAGEKPGRLWHDLLDARSADAAPAANHALPPARAAPPGAGTAPRLPRALMSLLENLACYRDDSRWELMYRLAWRTLFENPRVLEDPADPDVRHAQLMDRAVRRDLHKMHAFVRFREMVSDDAEPSFFAWFEPRHETIRKGAKFFVKRFPNMRWTIATPDGAAVWDGSTLTFLDSEPPAGRPRGDGNESLWRTYYRSICNVSRLNPRAMQREMPQHYWRNLPECAEIPALTRDGTARFAAGHEQSDHMQFTAAKAVQHFLSQGQEAEGIQACRACDIWRHATQGVPGAGPADARIMLVGEQPGDQEDLRGAAFVGPAGQVLDAALAAAGLPRNVVYVTNAVKHFKWEPRGKRRLHKKPSIAEIRACNPWLQGEIATVRPRVIVALGTSALAALNGAPSIEAAQGSNMMHPAGARILAAPHPSAILRADPGRAEQLRALLERVLEEAVRIARIARE